MSPHTQEKRKKLGAYYTPVDLSQVLTDWAIRSETDTVLEPSFGGCGFLEASVKSLEKVGSETPATSIYGADIDKKAFDFLSEKLGQLIDINNEHFKKKDFLKLKPTSFGNTYFDAVIGNPPYVSLHNMDDKQRKSCFDILDKSPFVHGTIGRNASLWAYFLIHTLQFISEGGRVAWVLPSSLLHADYARAVIDMHKSHFQSIKIVKLYERFFQQSGADEVSVILAADGFSTEVREVPSQIEYLTADNIQELQTTLEAPPQNLTNCDNYKYRLIDPQVLASYENLSNSESGCQLGDIAKVIIGMVTGDNKTFIIDEKKRQEIGLSNEILKPVISKFGQLSGFTHDMRKHRRLVSENHRCLLISPTDLKERNTPIRTYLSRVSKNNRKTNRTFPKRPLWFSPDDKLYPDAFLSYMIHKGPRLVLNSAKINCTNSIHKVFFTEKLSFNQKRAIAVSLYSSFSQLSAELEGRAYGSGVLKLEPTPAKKIKFLISERITQALNQNYRRINSLFMAGKLNDARILIDNCICDAENLSPHTFSEMACAIEQLRLERYKGLSKGHQ